MIKLWFGLILNCFLNAFKSFLMSTCIRNDSIELSETISQNALQLWFQVRFYYHTSFFNICLRFKKVNKTFCQSDVLDLSQNRSTRKSSYAIDSLTEHPKKADKGASKFNSTSLDMVPPVKDLSHQTITSSDNYDCPLNMCKIFIGLLVYYWYFQLISF